MNRKVIFRADANKEIGSGHLVRCLILARELQKKNVEIHFTCETLPLSYKEKMEKNRIGFTMIPEGEPDLEAILELKNRYADKETVLVIDSDKPVFYEKSFQQAVREAGLKLLMITFHSDAHFYSDVVLNQNLMALKDSYSTEPYTKLLLGTEYVVLNEQFRSVRNSESFQPYEEKMNVWLIYFGSSDQVDRTRWALSALLQMNMKPEKIHLVKGNMYPYSRELKEMTAQAQVPVFMYQNTPDMPLLMAESKFAISSGGLTVWELGLLEVTNIIVGESEREYRSGEFLAEEGYCYFLGRKADHPALELSQCLEEIIRSEKQNREKTKRLARKINPDGVKRVVREIINL